MTIPARLMAVLVATMAFSAYADTPAAPPSASFRFAITLSDGSVLFGTSPLQTLPFLPDSLGKIDVSVGTIDTIVISGDEPPVTVNFDNGDRLRGRFDPSVKFPLQTLVGPVAVPLNAVADVRIFPPGSGPLTDWAALPFPSGVGWDPADRGTPAQIRHDSMVLRGQPAWTEQSFVLPRTFECDVSLDKMNTGDGCLWILLIPDGMDPEADIPPHNLAIQFGYHAQGAGTGMFTISRTGEGQPKDFGNQPFDFVAGKPSHIKLEISATSIRATLNGNTFEDDGAIPFKKFRIELIGWQPGNTWTIQHIAVR